MPLATLVYQLSNGFIIVPFRKLVNVFIDVVSRCRRETTALLA